jgi:DHA1 family bicyclomycin/chloramphenicol resistance-like MFS transporter
MAAGVLLLVSAMWFAMPAPVALIGFFVLMTSQGLIGKPMPRQKAAVVSDRCRSVSTVRRPPVLRLLGVGGRGRPHG